MPWQQKPRQEETCDQIKGAGQAGESKRDQSLLLLSKNLISMAVSPLAAKPKETAKEREARERRREACSRC